MTDIAIIIPAYNAAQTLRATLDSALAQDHVLEIVVVDDGSRDDTLDVARAYEPRVRVLTGPNRGVSAARNRGIAETTAPWLLFLDADDVLEPGTVAARLALTGEADVVICDWRDLIDAGAGSAMLGPVRSIDWVKLAEGEEIAIATSVWATTAAILYRRELVERIGGFSEDLPILQDVRFLFDAAYHGARFTHAKHDGARYRVLANSLSRRDPAQFHLDLLCYGEQIQGLWRARGPLTRKQRQALAGIYDGAARGLFIACHASFFDAVRLRRRTGGGVPFRSRVEALLSRLVGVGAARAMVARAGAIRARSQLRRNARVLP